MMELHFETVTLILPRVIGTCTVPDGKNWAQGYNTPLTCKENSNGTRAYTYATNNAPVGFVETSATATGSSRFTHRCIKSISEVSAEIKPNDGIAARGSLNITFADFEGDPNDSLRGIGGTYFAKLKARNIIAERDVELKRYKVANGVISLVSTSHYKADTLTDMGGGKWVMRCKSIIEYTYEDYAQFPVPTGAVLRQDIDDTTATIPVFGADYNYAVDDVIMLGDEFMRVTAVNGSGTSQTLTVASRGLPITGAAGNITRTEVSEHDAGDDIQVCYVADNISIATYLRDILTTAGIDSSYINFTDWQNEVSDFWSVASISTVRGEPVEVKKLLGDICNDFMLDLWFDPLTDEIKLSAVSVWKNTSNVLLEGKGITHDSMKVKELDNLRCSRSYLYRDKRYKAANDDRINFKALSFYADLTFEGSDFYGKEKTVFLGGSENHTKDSGDLRTQRQVARYNQSPREFSWHCEERYLDYSVGDVVEFKTKYVSDADGSELLNRAQVLSISPKYNKVGRTYSVKAMTYAPAIGDTQDFVISGSQKNLNLWLQVGAPFEPVNITIVLDNVQATSSSNTIPSVRNGSFAAGSTITLVLINGTRINSKGGNGGNGSILVFDAESGSYIVEVSGQDGQDGGTCLATDGITTNVYLSGSYNSYTADGFILAAGGGGGGGGYDTASDSAGSGGGGGAGIDSGSGGAAGTVTPAGNDGSSGSSGTSTTGGNGGTASIDGGDGGDLGQNGLNGSGSFAGSGGLAGKGIFKASGETVTLFGSTAARFINGSGN